MDTGRGNMIPVENEAELGAEGEHYSKQIKKLTGSPASVFAVGEELQIKNSRFKVLRLGKTQMHLVILPL